MGHSMGHGVGHSIVVYFYNEIVIGALLHIMRQMSSVLLILFVLFSLLQYLLFGSSNSGEFL